MQVHYLLGLGGREVIPPELQGSMYDAASSPNDPVFILHHLMLDCILAEWVNRHPNAGYPVHPLVRDGHRRDDYVRAFFPIVTNGEVFSDPTEFGYYCELPNLGSTTAVGMNGTAYCSFIPEHGCNIYDSQLPLLLRLSSPCSSLIAVSTCVWKLRELQ